ncbi:hypothetical protein Scep_010082 [Stephania cephalantha]|uniref:Uncharacterized protein n=1 Tax=Stephania cephalantha TaxID=152367 RepID=A0AAP0JUS7_9MAGN
MKNSWDKLTGLRKSIWKEERAKKVGKFIKGLEGNNNNQSVKGFASTYFCQLVPVHTLEYELMCYEIVSSRGYRYG